MMDSPFIRRHDDEQDDHSMVELGNESPRNQVSYSDLAAERRVIVIVDNKSQANPSVETTMNGISAGKINPDQSRQPNINPTKSVSIQNRSDRNASALRLKTNESSL